MSRRTSAIGVVALILAATCRTVSPSAGPALSPLRSASFTDWPAGTAPDEVGRRLAANWAKRPFRFEANVVGRYESVVHYAEVATWIGALDVAGLISDRNLEQTLIRKFDTFLRPEGADRVSRESHVDFSIFGALPLDLYAHTRDDKYVALGRPFADRQWSNPSANGISREARYWADDLYMMTLLQVQAYRATGRRIYVDRMALAMASYLDSLQQPNGLFFHGADSPFFWGRGNGWAAAGMTELLRALPPDHPRRERILTAYRGMMATLLAAQSPSGLWRQLIDKPEVWEESSGSAMFAFAMVTGVRHGWLDAATYGPAARRAWLALVVRLDDQANLRDICVGTGKAAGEPGVGIDNAAQYRYYIARPRSAGDLHGQAPMLWTAAALLAR